MNKLKGIITLLVFLVSVPSAYAQVVITDNNLPGKGSIIRYANVNSPKNFYFPTPNSGSNQNWSYNFAQESSAKDTIRILAPANAPHIQNYPNANFVYVNSYKTYYYFQKQSDGLYLLAIESADFPFRPSKPLTWYKYPLQIGTMFSDSAVSIQVSGNLPDTLPFDSVKYVQTLKITSEATADGRITYNGTVAPKVVKERLDFSWKMETYARDTATGNWVFLNQQSQHRISYRWTSDKLGLSEVELEYNLNEDSVKYIKYVEGAAIQTGIFFETQSPFSLFPNPVQNILRLQTPTNDYINSLQVYDILGNIVLQEELKPNSRIRKYTLPTAQLPKGLYLLKIHTAQGNIYTHKFQKQ